MRNKFLLLIFILKIFIFHSFASELDYNYRDIDLPDPSVLEGQIKKFQEISESETTSFKTKQDIKNIQDQLKKQLETLKKRKRIEKDHDNDNFISKKIKRY